LDVDNAGVVKQAINTSNHAQAKHYRVSQAYIQQQVQDKQVFLRQVPSNDNASDFFTKALPRRPFEKHRLTTMGPQVEPEECASYM
jgi:hypothetical protein